MDLNASSMIFKPRIKPNMASSSRNIIIFFTIILLMLLISASQLFIALHLERDAISFEIITNSRETLSQQRSLNELKDYFLNLHIAGIYASIKVSNSFSINVLSSIATDYHEAECKENWHIAITLDKLNAKKTSTTKAKFFANNYLKGLNGIELQLL